MKRGSYAINITSGKCSGYERPKQSKMNEKMKRNVVRCSVHPALSGFRSTTTTVFYFTVAESAATSVTKS